MDRDKLLAAADHIRSVNEAEEQVKANRQKMFELVLAAIKTQPYYPYANDRTFTSENPDDRLFNFVSQTWVGDEAEKLFEHVTNRVLDALEKSGVII